MFKECVKGFQVIDRIFANFFSNSNVEVKGDGESLTISLSPFFGGISVGISSHILSGLDLEQVGTSNTARALGDTFLRSKMDELVEKLVNRAGSVGIGGNVDEILNNDLKLRKVGWNIDLFEDIGGGIGSNNEILESVIALRISLSVVSHTRGNSKDETTDGSEGFELLLDVGAGGETDLTETEALSSLHDVVVGSVVVVNVLLGKWGNVAIGKLVELCLSNLLSVEGELSEPRVLVELVEVEGCSLSSGGSHGESEDRSHFSF